MGLVVVYYAMRQRPAVVFALIFAALVATADDAGVFLGPHGLDHESRRGPDRLTRAAHPAV